MTREELASIIESLMEVVGDEDCSLGSLPISNDVTIIPWSFSGLTHGWAYMAVRGGRPLFAEGDNLTLLQCLDMAKEQGLME